MGIGFMFKKQDICGYLKGFLYALFAHRLHRFRDAPYAYEPQVKCGWTIPSLTLDFPSPLNFVQLPDCSFIKRHSLYFFQNIRLIISIFCLTVTELFSPFASSFSSNDFKAPHFFNILFTLSQALR